MPLQSSLGHPRHFLTPLLSLCRRLGSKLLAILWGSALALTLASCAGSPSTLAPASRQAGSIASLFWTVTGLAVAIFVVTEALLFIALIRFRHRPESPRQPTQVHGNIRLEVAWTLAPLIIVAGVFVATVGTMYQVTAVEPNELKVRVVGHQWWWEVQYPGLGIATATDLHVPVGRPIYVELVSEDVIHSFWAPELAGKTDVIPGHTNASTFTVDRAGKFRGACAEFCGAQHANMGFEVIAEPPEQFDAWVKAQQAPSAAPAEGAAAEGARIFQRNACVSCHTIAGTTAQGKVGPDLTHFGSRGSIAALARPNTLADLAAWLTDPQAIKKGAAMPNLYLSGEAIGALAAYLEGLK